jgi:hypothetical protein
MHSFLSTSSANRATPDSYSSEALRRDLERVRIAWEECQSIRDRNAIYGYLNAVYGVVAWWAADGREVDRARRALRLQRLKVSHREDPFAAVIRCTADPAKADKRTPSKWQVGFGAPGSVHPAQGRHQRLRCPFHPAPGARRGNEIADIFGKMSRLMRYQTCLENDET